MNTDIDSATATLSELEERVRDGDATVTESDIASAHSRLTFARLRHEAAERAAERQARSDHAAAVEAVTAERDALFTQALPALTKKYTAAVEALRSLRESLDEHRVAESDLRSRGRELGIADDPRDLGDVDRFVEHAARDAAGITAEYAHALHSQRVRRVIDERTAAIEEAERQRIAQYEAQLDTTETVAFDGGATRYVM